MSLRETLRNSLVTVAAVAALSMPASGCVQGKQYQTVPKAKETVESYVMEYDVPTIQLAIQLYAQDYKKMPQSFADIMPYSKIAADVNDNGVLDNKLEMKVYKVNGVVHSVYVKETTRAEATDAKREIVKETWLRLNKDNSVTVKSSANMDYINARDQFLTFAKTKVEDMVKSSSAAKKAGESYQKLKAKVVKPQGSQ